MGSLQVFEFRRQQGTMEGKHVVHLTTRKSSTAQCTVHPPAPQNKPVHSKDHRGTGLHKTFQLRASHNSTSSPLEQASLLSELYTHLHARYKIRLSPRTRL